MWPFIRNSRECKRFMIPIICKQCLPTTTTTTRRQSTSSEHAMMHGRHSYSNCRPATCDNEHVAGTGIEHEAAEIRDIEQWALNPKCVRGKLCFETIGKCIRRSVTHHDEQMVLTGIYFISIYAVGSNWKYVIGERTRLYRREMFVNVEGNGRRYGGWW